MLIRFIIFIIILYVVYRIIKYMRRAKNNETKNYQAKAMPAEREDLVEDPFCHTYIPVSQAYKKEIAGINYYFCSKECCEYYISGKSKKRQEEGL